MINFLVVLALSWGIGAFVSYLFIRLFKNESKYFDPVDWFITTTPIVNSLFAALMVAATLCYMVTWFVEYLVETGISKWTEFQNKRTK